MEYKTGPALRRLRLQSRMPIQEVAALTGLGVTKLSTLEGGIQPTPRASRRRGDADHDGSGRRDPRAAGDDRQGARGRPARAGERVPRGCRPVHRAGPAVPPGPQRLGHEPYPQGSRCVVKSNKPSRGLPVRVTRETALRDQQHLSAIGSASNSRRSSDLVNSTVAGFPGLHEGIYSIGSLIFRLPLPVP